MENGFVGVRLLDAPIHADREYTYYIPRELSDRIALGVFVSVPFGGGNRRKRAVVTSVFDHTDVPKCKPVATVDSRAVMMTEELLGLCRFMCEYTLCTFGDAVRACVPSGVLSKVTEIYSATETEEEEGKALNSKAQYVYGYIKSRGKVSLDRLKSNFDDTGATEDILSSLVKKGLIERSFEVSGPTNKKSEARISLAISPEEAMTVKCSKRGREILDHIIRVGETDEKELKDAFGVISSPLRTLTEHGYVKLEYRDVYRNPFAGLEKAEKEPLMLTSHQKDAYEKLYGLYSSGEAKAALLHGVTGSGKTSVIRAMIDAVTADGRSVIILVPEIALTPQTVRIFCSNYGDRVAVIHSSLSEGERLDAWRRIRAGEADIVIGTRSAVFAPTENLGMIVIDEEQEHTYKSDTNPKYTAHDIARYRCAANGALMLLSSATPSLGSYYKTETGTYTLVSLTERYGEAKLPEVIVADRRKDRDSETNVSSPIGSVLEVEIRKNLAAGEQTILFLNRRGYNNFLSCKNCGEAVLCPHCSVALTYHARRRVQDTESKEDYRAEHIDAGSLCCHYCGYTSKAPSVCPSCGSDNLFYMGWGTQRVEQELERLFPTARILRMDADTTRTKASYDEILGSFGRHEADILIGTQMVTKGHDFPLVTLVGVLMAESSMYLDDYRAGERTFSLITQVTGRAGRAERSGRAVIQTYSPENEVLKFAAAQDYVSFYKSEIKLRRGFEFPPFCDIAQFTMTSEDESELSLSVVRLAAYIKQLSETEFSDVALRMYGPFEASVYRVGDRYRMRILCKCKLTKRTRRLFDKVIKDFGAKLGKRVTLSTDFNPTSI